MSLGSVGVAVGVESIGSGVDRVVSTLSVITLGAPDSTVVTVSIGAVVTSGAEDGGGVVVVSVDGEEDGSSLVLLLLLLLDVVGKSVKDEDSKVDVGGSRPM